LSLLLRAAGADELLRYVVADESALLLDSAGHLCRDSCRLLAGLPATLLCCRTSNPRLGAVFPLSEEDRPSAIVLRDGGI